MERRIRFWFLFAVSLGVVGALACMLFATLRPQRVEEPPSDPRVPRLIDGIRVEPGKEKSRLVGIILDGNVDGRPTLGLARAPLVWEVPVEGGIPRFLALYPFDSIPDVVGPVRSLRPYFLDFALEVQALLLYVGGSPEALTLVRSSLVERLNQFFDYAYFWRSRDRRAPHNVLTSQYLVSRAFTDRALRTTSEFVPWRYVSCAPDERGVRPCFSEHTGTFIRLPFGTPTTLVEWQWNRERSTYERFVSGERHRDGDGTPIDAKNILVQFTTIEILDTMGRRRITTEGEGNALVLTNGNMVAGTWKKGGGGRTRFYDQKTGEEIALTPGTTWIEVLSKNIEQTLTKESL